MNNSHDQKRKMTNVFERYLTLWVTLCIVSGILLGKLVPSIASTLDGMAIYVDAAPAAMIGASNHFEVAIANIDYAFRSFLWCGSGYCYRRPYRSTRYADVSENLFTN